MNGAALLLLALAASAQPAADVSEAQREAARAALEGQAPPPSGAAEVKSAAEGGFADFLAGRYAAAAAGFKYIVTLGGADAAPEAELALMLRDDGRPDEAAAHWLKATLLASTDAFLWNQRAWNYLALGRTREAKDSFRKAAATAQRSDDKGEALLGLGLSESFDANPKAAVEPLQQAAKDDPYAAAAANSELSRLEAAQRRPASAVPYAVASLQADNLQLDVARQLARLYDKTGQGKAEWQAWKLVLDLDPADPEALKRKGILEKWLPARPEDSLPVMRLGRPVYREGSEEGEEAAADNDSPPVRIALFSGPDGRPRHLTRFFVMGSTGTKLFDVNLGEEMLAPTPPFTQWEVVYRPDTRVIEVRDSRGQTRYLTKQPFRLMPGDFAVKEDEGRRGSRFTVLVKNPELTDIRGMDLGDREYRGFIEVVPTPDGFHLVNELPLDRYLFSVVGEALPPNAPLEAYKTMAVLTRSTMLARLQSAQPNPERTQTCDSKACMSYYGLTRERENSAKGVRLTRGLVARAADGALPEHHPSCGWASSAGIQDRQSPTLAFRSPADLERLIHRGPDEGLYHQATALLPEAWNRWLRVLDAEEVRARAERRKDIGPLKRIVVLGRDATGRAKGLRLEGSRGELELNGLEEMASVLSPGSLRSELFAVTPLYDGRKIQRLVLFGAGYGHGRGVCVAGTVGQAHLGRRFDQILKHYYPRLLLPGFTPPPEPPAPKPAVVAPPRKKPVLVPGQRPPRKRRPTLKI
ncbi:hypothetical protein EPO15_01795 [bacterium]|nr:MAG: hypothetical protein EPO15_01795 [bacterium]